MRVWVVAAHHTNLPHVGRILGSPLPDITPDAAIERARVLNEKYHGIFFERYQAEIITLPAASSEFSAEHSTKPNSDFVAEMDRQPLVAPWWIGPLRVIAVCAILALMLVPILSAIFG